VKENQLEFYPLNDFFEPLQPASKFVPAWFKQIPAFANYKIELDQKTVKLCVPFLDALTTGYMLTLQTDVVVNIKDGVPFFAWNIEPAPIALREKGANNFPIPRGCHDLHFSWVVPFHIKPPSDYSLLITHPNNRYDLPFTTMSGIADVKTVMPSGNLPFFLAQGFEGIIPKGTPVAQIILYKKENWKTKKNPNIVKEAEKEKFLTNSVVKGYYKKNNWLKTIFS